MKFRPIIEGYIRKEQYVNIDLSAETLNQYQINASNQDELKKYLLQIQKKASSSILCGGYLEKRNLYDDKSLFSEKDRRNIHLGLDFWAPAGTGIRCPKNGQVVVSHYHQEAGNYGGTIILKHATKTGYYYSLYGHLSKFSLVQNKLGEKVQEGKVFCWLGAEDENGGYEPHLHFQLMRSFDETQTDYPGVSSLSQLSIHQKNSINPAHFLGILIN